MPTTATADSLRAGPDIAVTVGYGLPIARDPLAVLDPDKAPSRCQLRIYRPTTGLVVVVFSDGPENNGTSVTNAVDRLACIALDHFIDSKDWPSVLFLQHYPPTWFSQWPINSRPNATHWTEEVHHVMPVIRWDGNEERWTTGNTLRTQFHLVAQMYGCELHLAENLQMSQDAPAMLAVTKWIMGRDVNLLTPDIPSLLMHWGLRGVIAAQGVTI